MCHSEGLLRGDHPGPGCSLWDAGQNVSILTFKKSCFSEGIKLLLSAGYEAAPLLQGLSWGLMPGVVGLSPISGLTQV